MILIFCFNNLFEVLKKFFFDAVGVMSKYIIKTDISKALKWNLIINSLSIYNWFILINGQN